MLAPPPCPRFASLVQIFPPDGKSRYLYQEFLITWCRHEAAHRAGGEEAIEERPARRATCLCHWSSHTPLRGSPWSHFPHFGAI